MLVYVRNDAGNIYYLNNLGCKNVLNRVRENRVPRLLQL